MTTVKNYSITSVKYEPIAPLTLTAEQLASPGMFELARQQSEAAVAEQQRRAMQYLNGLYGPLYVPPPFAGVDRTRPVESLKIRTPVGDIAMRADPTLRPGEFALDRPAPPCPFAIGDYVRSDFALAIGPTWYEGTIETLYPTDPGFGASVRIARGSNSNYAPGDRVPYADAANLRKVERPEPDPLDAVIDGVPLRTLLQDDGLRRRENRAAMARCRVATPAQRAAVSAHWSAELRAKVAASAERDRNQVRVDLQDEP